MADERSIKIKFLGDTTDLNRAAKQGEQAMGSWATSLKGFAGAVAGLEIGEKLFEFAKDSVKAYSEAQVAQLKLSDAFQRFPKLAGTNIEAFRELNEELENKTKFDHNAYASGEAILAQFKLTGAQIEQIIPLAADLAAKTGEDLPTATETLGKAFLGQTKALKELGINYKTTHDQAKDTAAITQLVREKVGGFADKEGKTAAGQAEILSNKFEAFKETVGEKLIPVLIPLGTILLNILTALAGNLNILGPLAAAIGAVVVVQWLWNAAMDANPIGLAIIGIALLIAGIVLLVKNVKVIGQVWGAIWGVIKDTGIAIFNQIAWAWNHTFGLIDFTVPSWIPGIGGQHWAVPKIPTFHEGGVVAGRGNQLALLRGGEGVFTPEQMQALGVMNGPTEVHVYIGDTELTQLVDARVVQKNAATRSRVLSMAGAR